MTVECPDCGARYRIRPPAGGQRAGRVRCPKCSRVFEVDLDAQGGCGTGPETPAEKILVVDDAPFFRELIVDILKPLGVPVMTAADAETALETVRRERPALVILDLNLPTMDGYELIRALRADGKLARVRILAMSGVFRKDEDVAAVQRAGADDFTSKSFKPEQFLERVRKILGA